MGNLKKREILFLIIFSFLISRTYAYLNKCILIILAINIISGLRQIKDFKKYSYQEYSMYV